jgi:hypothetical protein
MKTTATVLCSLFNKPNEHTFRICIPGIDGTSAVWFETTIERPSRPEAYELLRVCVENLKVIDIETCYECDGR